MIEYPKITLVTPSYNQAQFIEATLQSVISQNYPNLEYIVIDGGSNDGSVEIIQRYAPHLTYWISEPDAGQTDAIIKGFAKSSGVILNWLNSDDLLLPNSLLAVAQAYQESQADIIVGEDLHFRGDRPDIPVFHFRPAHYNYPECYQFWKSEFRYHQPCTFFSKKIYERSGGLNRDLHYLMDYDLYCRILEQQDIKLTYLPQPLSAFRLHDSTKTARFKSKFLQEQHQIFTQNLPMLHFTKKDHLDLNKYMAKCNLHNAVDSCRKYDWETGLQSFLNGIKADPIYFCYHALTRILRITSRLT
jgi:glycosyltransferase involved in cell wall biosynthesis